MTTTLRTRDPGPELPGLVETLDTASAQHFDLAALRVGVDGVRHRRRRRRQAVVVSGAVAAVLVGGGLTWTLDCEPPSGAVVRQPAEPTVTASDPAPDPAPSVATVPDPGADRIHVPDAVVPAAVEVGAGRELTSDLGQYADVPVVMG